MTAEEVRQRLIAECEKVGTAGAWAKANSISPAYVSDVVKGHREAGEKILQALGLEKVVTFRKARA